MKAKSNDYRGGSLKGLIIKSIFLVLFLFLSSIKIVQAINSQNEGYRVNYSSIARVDSPGMCKKVINNSGKHFFVPTKTSGQWGSFFSAVNVGRLSGVSFCECNWQDSCGGNECTDAGSYNCNGSCTGISYKGSNINCSGGHCNGGGSCVSSVQDCTASISYATSATQIWNGGGWGDCTPASCSGGYHVVGLSCVPDCVGNQGQSCGGNECVNAGSYSCSGSCDGMSNKGSNEVCSGGHCDGGGTCVADAVSCTDFNYSAWAGCDGSTETRTVISTVPPTCTGGVAPVLSQSCSSPCTSWTYFAWAGCDGTNETRTIQSSSPSGCSGGSPILSQACTLSCTDFNYSAWGACNGTNQTRVVTSTVPPVCTGGVTPSLSQACALACTSLNYSVWAGCDGITETRTVISTVPSTCTGGVVPVLSQSCSFPCTSWTYSAWAGCDGINETRTIQSSGPSGCSGGSPILSQACTLPCTGFNYSAWGACNGTSQVRVVTSKIPSTCTGGVAPVLSQACTIPCTSWTYSAWASCSGTSQSRTIQTSSPSSCSGGSPILSQSCCQSTFHTENNYASCISDTRTCAVTNGVGSQTWGGSSWSACTVASCYTDYHPNGPTSCISNTQSCTITNASSATQTWNGSGWGTCTVVACNSTYHPENNNLSCVYNIQTCVSGNGMGTKTWNGSGWPATCTLNSCDLTFHTEDNYATCVSNTKTCTANVTNADSATQTWSGGAWGVCTVSACSANYHKVSNNTACNNDYLNTWLIWWDNGTPWGAYDREDTTHLSYRKFCKQQMGSYVSYPPYAKIENMSYDAYWRFQSVANDDNYSYYPFSLSSTVRKYATEVRCYPDENTVCGSGTHVENGACVSNSRSCTITNGTGTQTWDGVMDWNACTVVSCNDDYHPNTNNTGCNSDDINTLDWDQTPRYYVLDSNNANGFIDGGTVRADIKKFCQEKMGRYVSYTTNTNTWAHIEGSGVHDGYWRYNTPYNDGNFNRTYVITSAPRDYITDVRCYNSAAFCSTGWTEATENNKQVCYKTVGVPNALTGNDTGLRIDENSYANAKKFCKEKTGTYSTDVSWDSSNNATTAFSTERYWRYNSSADNTTFTKTYYNGPSSGIFAYQVKCYMDNY